MTEKGPFRTKRAQVVASEYNRENLVGCGRSPRPALKRRGVRIMKFKRFAMVVMMAAIMMLPIAAFASSVYDEGHEYEAEEFDHWEWMYSNVTAVTLDTFTGVVTGIELTEPQEDSQPFRHYIEGFGYVGTFARQYTTIHVEGEEGLLVFRAEYIFSVLIGDEIAIDDVVTIYFEADRPLTQIYPPQYEAWLVVNGDFPNMVVSRFDENWLSYDGSLKLDAGSEIELLNNQNRTIVPIDDMLHIFNMLVVVYDSISDATPAVITPNIMVVLPEYFQEGVFTSDRDLTRYEVVIFVPDGPRGIADASIAVIGDNVLPTHATLRPILAAFDIEPSWNALTREVEFTNLDGIDVSFRVGTDFVTLGGRVVPLRYNSVIINNSTYVPVDFFSDILGVCFVGVAEQQVTIDCFCER